MKWKEIVLLSGMLTLFLGSCQTSGQTMYQPTQLGDLLQEDLSRSLINPDTIMGAYTDLDEEGRPFIAERYVFARPPVLGFMGDDYARFRIHFNEVCKQGVGYKVEAVAWIPGQKLYTFVEGAIWLDSVRVLSSTQGSTLAARLRDEGITERGIIYASYRLKSRTDDVSFTGRALYYYAKVAGQYRYDAYNLQSDGYYNNQYEGVCTIDGQTYVCNWGDFRVPQSGTLDVGVAEFVPSGGKGWEQYDEVMGDNVLRKRDMDWWRMKYLPYFGWDLPYEKTLESAYAKVTAGVRLTGEELRKILPASQSQFYHYVDEGTDHSTFRYQALADQVWDAMWEGDFELAEAFLRQLAWTDGHVAEAQYDEAAALLEKYPREVKAILDKLGYYEAVEEWRLLFE